MAASKSFRYDVEVRGFVTVVVKTIWNRKFYDPRRKAGLMTPRARIEAYLRQSAGATTLSIAEACGLSRSYTLRLLRECVGVSMHETECGARYPQQHWSMK